MRHIRRVCVFCGSNEGANTVYKTTAQELGRAVAARGWGLVYGGAKVGLMGAVADAATGAGGEVFGVIPDRLVQRELAHDALTELFVVDSMHARKALMAHLSDGFCVLPGGWGTLEEAFEVLTWTQLGYHRKPLALVGPLDFWGHLSAHADLAVREGFLMPAHRALMRVSADVEGALDHLAQVELPEVPKWIDRP